MSAFECRDVTVLFSIFAAVAYGLGDFNGGVLSKRGGAWAVALVAQLAGTMIVLVVSLIDGGHPTRSDLLWAVLAGAGSGFGTVFLYRGLSSGRMSVVAPVSGLGAIALPASVGVLIGERPGLLVWAGVVLALPAIWLVSRESDDERGAVAGRAAKSVAQESSVTDGILAGLGFGALFVALAQIPEEGGFLPLALYQAVGAVVIVLVAVSL